MLLYATGMDHPLRAPCRSIMAAVGRGSLVAYTTDVVLAEFVHARARRTSRQHAVAGASHLISLLDDVLVLDDDARRRALALYPASGRLSINDVLIAAAALENDLPLVSADRDFEGVVGLTLIEPDSAAVGALTS